MASLGTVPGEVMPGGRREDQDGQRAQGRCKAGKGRRLRGVTKTFAVISAI